MLGAISARPRASAIQRCGRLRSAGFLGSDQEEDRGRRHEVGHRVLGVEAEAEREAEDERPDKPRPLRQLDEGKEGRGPGEEKRDVGRDDAGRERDAGQGCEGRGRPEARFDGIEPAPDQKDQDAGQSVDQRRGKADAEFAVAADLARAGDDPGNERRLRVVAKGELAAPGPVLGLVGEKIRAAHRERKNAKERQRAEKNRKEKDRWPGLCRVRSEDRG